MSEVGMALDDTDLTRIGDYVKGNIYGWLVEVAPQVVAGPQILERMERFEQELVAQRHELVAQRHELKAQRELMETRFDAVDVRFEDMNRRFEDTNKRFEDMNSRFNGMQWLIGVGFGLIATIVTIFEFIT
ncbi:MAG: hypothetical protein OXJ90_22645 [Spirochaetaceae bacterium]|nr:hypothetical protein [Spirochaetaceae bacterium]